MMKKIWLWALPAALLLTRHAFAWSYGEFISCNAMNPMPTVVLKTSFGRLVHDFNQTTNQLNQKGTPEKGYFKEGIATRPLRTYIALKQYQVMKIDERATCILPAEVEFFIGYKSPEIYVSKDIDFQSCRFSVAVRHEQVHQRINKLVLEHFLPLFFEELKLAVQDVKAVKVASPEQADAGVDMLVKYYRKRLEAVVDMYQKILDTEQKKLDNLTNYQMEWDLCKKYNEAHSSAQ